MLIERDDLGNWRLNGVRWMDLYEGAVLTASTSQMLYSALCELKDYEEIGSVSEFEEIKEREVSRPPHKYKESDGAVHMICDVCAAPLTDDDGWRADYCPHCGQRILWS